MLLGNEYSKAMDAIMAYQNAAIICGQHAGALSEAERYSKLTVVDRTLLEHQIVQTAQDGDKKQEKMQMTAGCIELYYNLWNRSHDIRARAELAGYAATYGRLAYEVGVLHGGYIENMTYIQKYDQLLLANGGYMGPAPVLLPQMTMAKVG